MKIIYPNIIKANLLGGAVIAYFKTFTVNSISKMIVAIIFAHDTVCLPESCETIVSSLLTYECSSNLLQFMFVEKCKFSFG